METAQVLKLAMEAVEEAGIKDPLRSIAYAKAVDLIARGGSVAVGEVEVHNLNSDAAVGEHAVAIAKELEIDAKHVERLFDELDDQLQFVGAVEKLGASKQLKVEKMAVLLCAARQAAGFDDDGRTSDAVVRAEVERHGLYDVTNYSKHVKPLARLTNVNGSGKAATYKMKYEGRVEARSIAQRLLAE